MEVTMAKQSAIDPNGDTTPYQFLLPTSLKVEGLRKAADNGGIDIAPFMRMAWEQFIEMPIDELMNKLKAHKRRHRVGKKKKKKGAIKL